MAKKKKAQMLFKLVSTAGTGFFYVGEKNVKMAARKLSMMKYDPMVNRHVLFNEMKLKKWVNLLLLVYPTRLLRGLPARLRQGYTSLSLLRPSVLD